MALFSISQERVDLTRAKFDYDKAIRRTTRGLKVRGVLNELFLGVPSLVVGKKLRKRFFEFHEEEYVEAHPDSALAHSRDVLEDAARTYAEFRAQKQRIVPDQLRKSVELRTRLEIASAIRLSRMSLLERIPGSTMRFLFKTRLRAGISALALAAFLFLTPAGAKAAASAGSFYTKNYIATGLYGATRTAGAYAPYIKERVKDLVHGTSDEDVWGDAARYAFERAFSGRLTTVLGMGGGLALRDYFADAVAQWFHLSSPDEHMRETVVNTREGLLDDIAAKRGEPEYMPDAHMHAGALDAALTETDIVSEARRSSLLLENVHDRIAEFRSGKILLVNGFRNKDLLEDGLEHLKRLETLEAARVRYEALVTESGGHPDPSDPAISFLQKSLADLLKEREAASAWVSRFDDAAQAGADRFAGDHSKGVVQLSAEYLLTHHRHHGPHAHADLFPAPQGIPELSLTSGDITPESFDKTLATVSAQLQRINADLLRYHQVLDTEDDAYTELVASKENCEHLLKELNDLQPFVSRFDSIRAAIGPYEPHAGEDLSEALLRERIRQLDFHHFADAWPAILGAETKIHSVKTGMILLGDQLVSIRSVVDFKDDAGSELPAPLARSIYEYSEELKRLGLDDMRVTEGYPLTRPHMNPGQEFGGNSVDIALAGRDYSPEKLDKLFSAESGVTNAHVAVVLETNEYGLYTHLLTELKNKGYDADFLSRRIKYYPGWISATHLSFYTEEPELAGLRHLVHAAANENIPEVHAKAA